MPSGLCFTLEYQANVTKAVLLLQILLVLNQQASSTNTIILKNSAQATKLKKAPTLDNDVGKQMLTTQGFASAIGGLMERWR